MCGEKYSFFHHVSLGRACLLLAPERPNGKNGFRSEEMIKPHFCAFLLMLLFSPLCLTISSVYFLTLNGWGVIYGKFIKAQEWWPENVLLKIMYFPFWLLFCIFNLLVAIWLISFILVIFFAILEVLMLLP